MKLRHGALAVFALSLGLTASPAMADWLESLKKALGSFGQSDSTAESIEAVLSEDDLIRGLKEALQVGVDRAIDVLGAEGGFLDDRTVRIPMPALLEEARPALAMFGQEKIADDFEATLNRAAERAVPLAATVFSDAIRAMSIQDANGILRGADDAATRYFREHAGGPLKEAMLPIVRQATDETGATSAYKRLTDKASAFLGSDDLDLDSYVTDRAVDGLFLKLAEQEKLIRDDPLARSSELLKKVFSAAQ